MSAPITVHVAGSERSVPAETTAADLWQGLLVDQRNGGVSRVEHDGHLRLRRCARPGERQQQRASEPAQDRQCIHVVNPIEKRNRAATPSPSFY